MIGLKEAGCSIEVYAFDRGVYPTNTNIEPVILGKLKAGIFWNRLLTYCKALPKYLELTRSEVPVYIFGFDNLVIFNMVSWLTRRRPLIIYEVADIHSFQTKNNPFGSIIKGFDSWLMKRVRLSVLTSREFYLSYFKTVLGLKLLNFQVIENKVSTPGLGVVKSFGLAKHINGSNDKITIGYFGLLRCRRSLEILIDGAEKQYWNLVLRGVFLNGTLDFIEKIQNLEHVSYYGAYVSPIDLEIMYSEIDISWIAYPYSKESIGNWLWAKTNRYYESAYYKTPMIASVGTQDGNLVQVKSIGLTVDLADLIGSVNKIAEISKSQIDLWGTNIEALDTRDFVITDEYLLLSKRIKELISH